MANIPIPNLPRVIALDGTELVEVVQNGTSASATTNQVASLYGTSTVPLTAVYATTVITIAKGSLEVYYDATAGEIDQVLPALSTLAAYDRRWMRFWKVDGGANAVRLSSADGFLGQSSPQVLGAQGDALTVEINLTLGKYLVVCL